MTSNPSQTQAKDLWREAVEVYKKSVSKENWNKIIITKSANDVRKEIEKLKDQRGQKWDFRLLRRLYSICENMQDYIGVVDTFVQSDPTVSALVWGSLKFVLQVSWHT